jgi:hypothetical protein
VGGCGRVRSRVIATRIEERFGCVEEQDRRCPVPLQTQMKEGVAVEGGGYLERMIDG